MPNRRKAKKGSASGPGQNGERVVVVSGNARISASVTVGNVIDSLSLADNTFTNLAALSDMYGLYRYTALWVELFPSISSTVASGTRLYGIGFTPEPLLANPASIAETMQMPFGCFLGVAASGNSNFGESVSKHFRVNRKSLLHTGVKWFRTQGRGTETDWEIQGTFVFAVDMAAATTASTFYGWVHYTCEFTDVLPTSVTFSRMEAQLADKVRAEILASVAAPTKSLPCLDGRALGA